MATTRSNSLFSVIFILCLVACSSGHNNYSSYHTLPDEGWAYTDSVVFTPELFAPEDSGTLVLGLRHGADYRYSNLWLEVTRYTDSVTVERDTVCIELCDRFGKWHGTGLGASFQLSDTLGRRMALASGKPLVLRHIMRADTVECLEQIGIIFTSDITERQ